LNQYVVPLPPLGAQKRIAVAIKSNVEQSFEYAGQFELLLQTLGKLQASVLESALTGHLVPQDKSEGTGHDLVGKIRQMQPNIETVVAPKTKKSSKAKSKK
jgi:hypothetical protein